MFREDLGAYRNVKEHARLMITHSTYACRWCPLLEREGNSCSAALQYSRQVHAYSREEAQELGCSSAAAPAVHLLGSGSSMLLSPTHKREQPVAAQQLSELGLGL